MGTDDNREHGALSKGPMLGAAFGLALVGSVIATGSDSVNSLFSLGGLVIVFGGVTAVAFMSFDADDVFDAMGSVVAMLRGGASGSEPDLRRDMEDIVCWSEVLRDTGSRGLEHSLGSNRTADPLVTYGLNIVVSDYAPDEVRAMMQTAAEGSHQRANMPVEVLRAMGSHAPAFGMVGTLIGMVSMLHGLTAEAETIGKTLAVAFLSTLYGVLSARMIYLPAASRLERQVEAQCLRAELVTEGMVLLARLKSPMFIRDRLNAFLQPESRNYFNIIDGVAVPGMSAKILLRDGRQEIIPRALQSSKA